VTLSRLIRFTAMILIPALLSNSFASAAKKPADPAAMKAKIQARGVGQGVRVVLTDKTEAKGLIASISENSFTVKAKNADQPREIEYAQVTGVHGAGMTKGQKIGLGVGIFGAAVLIAGLVVAHAVASGPFP
jgi:hypothetical protein